LLAPAACCGTGTAAPPHRFHSYFHVPLIQLPCSFDTYDLDHSGFIDEQEFVEMMKNVNDLEGGSDSECSNAGNIAKGLSEFDQTDDGSLDRAEFRQVVLLVLLRVRVCLRVCLCSLVSG
jgi:hypothetical protein